MKTIYICMPYRGKNADDATPEEIQANILDAMRVSNDIVHKFPEITPYCPHGCEELAPLNEAWRNGEVSTAYIMIQCIDKLEECDAILIIGDETDGMKLEHEYSNRHGIVVYQYPQWDYETMKQFAYDWLSCQ